ncbi:MAG: SagB/ThcOx family dehydrogenase [Candidatus Theseobacter exili]|nr:SagB/ThcOx family dehydrogenase [Candidatus Theseobacter exili]
MKALNERHSSRSFSAKELSQQVLSNLLWASSGINRPKSGFRTAPSAVNRQEIDVYVALKSGLYLYDAKKHSLEPVIEEDIRAQVGVQAFTQTAPVSLVFVADYTKMGTASLDDKKFYSATDTGFISQNVYLFCASEGLSTVVLGWIDRPTLVKKMQLKDYQKVILTQPVGYPAE